MKILVFQSSPNWGGIESFIRNVVVPLKELDEITIVNADISNKLLERYRISSDSFVNLGSLRHPIKYMRALKKVLSRDYSIVHFNKNSAVNIIPLLLTKLLSKAKILVHSHNTAPSKNGFYSELFHYLNRPILCSLADRKVACSEVAAEYMFGRRNAGSVPVIPNGIDVDRFQFNFEVRKKLRAEFGIGEEALLIGNVGRFSPQKNQAFLLSLFEYMRSRQMNVYLMLVGDGKLKEQLEKEVKLEGSSDRVKILSNRTDVNKLYQAMDVFVMPSFYEGLPISCIEAQAAGLPIVASDVLTHEIDLTNKTSYLPLSVDSCVWSDKVLEAVRGNQDRSLDAKKVSSSGYSNFESSKMLRLQYLEMVGADGI